MTNLILYGYYYRYRQARKSVKDLVSADNFSTAKTILDQYIQEHDAYMQNNSIPIIHDNFTTTDNASLHHASAHMEAVIFNPNNQIQKQATIDALDETG